MTDAEYEHLQKVHAYFKCYMAQKPEQPKDYNRDYSLKTGATIMPDKKPSYLNFDEGRYAWKPDIDYREHPELYRVGKGEQGVLICEPYKSEIGQFWRFKTPAIAKISCEKIYQLFEDYLDSNDFVGADMARKYLQMGYTRARRYANYQGGKKYDKEDGYRLMERGTGNKEKAESAQVFYQKWKTAEADITYKKLKTAWKHERG